MRRFRTYIIVCGILVVLGLLLLTGWLFIPRDVYQNSIMVEQGDKFHKVVLNLNENNVIDSPWIFSKIGIIIGLDRHIMPGRYDFQGKNSNYDVIRKLWRGEIAVIKVTIPEGLTAQKIGDIINMKCGMNRDKFEELSHDSAFLADLGISYGKAEGYLFPETYRFQWGISAREAISNMSRFLFEKINDSLLEKSASIGFDLHQLLTMASIVESEGSVIDEFPTIASVYLNRLNIGMKLQADPTVIYGMGGLDRKLMQRDYNYPSEYNTYLHEGLPPTPICSPGMDAILAVLYPDSTDYLYFVADGSGRHVFNKTYQGHLRDIRRIKEERRRR